QRTPLSGSQTKGKTLQQDVVNSVEQGSYCCRQKADLEAKQDPSWCLEMSPKSN
uniref:Uncharacterized protein n=1 Tax=Poecilia formosa TaxID=48698 RepID=A0A096MC94_POEFO